MEVEEQEVLSFNRKILISVALMIVGLPAVLLHAERVHYGGKIDGQQIVPSAEFLELEPSSGGGTLSLVYDTDTDTFDIFIELHVEGELDPTGANIGLPIPSSVHLHRGRTGEASALHFYNTSADNWVNEDGTKEPKSGRWSYEALDQRFINGGTQQDLDNGDVYVNVHTTFIRSGELRGQVGKARLTSYGSRLDGLQVVPTAESVGLSPSTATGTLKLLLNSATGLFDIELRLEGLLGEFDPTAANIGLPIPSTVHIHEGALGESSPVHFYNTLASNWVNEQGTQEPMSGNWTYSAKRQAFINGGSKEDFDAQNTYINVHTTYLRSGELRGQIKPSEFVTYKARLDSSQTVPPASALGQEPSTASGELTMVLDTATELFELQIDLHALLGEFDPTAQNIALPIPSTVHLHQGMVGESSPLHFYNTFFDKWVNEDGTGEPQSGDWHYRATEQSLINGATQEDFDLGNVYVNVHTTYVRPGELRGQLIRAGRELAAYNDFSWAEGQLSDNITLYTTEAGAGTPPQGSHGFLVDHSTGQPTLIRLAVLGGLWNGGNHTRQGALADAGTDAYEVFKDKVDAQGVLSYAASSDTVLELDGLDPAMRYELVLFGNRARTSYGERKTKTTISGVTHVENHSSLGADFVGVNDESTIIAHGYNTQEGYVTRFSNIHAGSDGAIKVILSDGGSNVPPKTYLNAFCLKAHAPGAGYVTQIGFSNAIQGAGDVTEFFAEETLYLTVQDVDLDPQLAAEQTRVTAQLSQNGTELAVPLTHEAEWDAFVGSVELASFAPGEVQIQILGLVGEEILLERSSSIFINE